MHGFLYTAGMLIHRILNSQAGKHLMAKLNVVYDNKNNTNRPSFHCSTDHMNAYAWIPLDLRWIPLDYRWILLNSRWISSDFRWIPLDSVGFSLDFR